MAKWVAEANSETLPHLVMIRTQRDPHEFRREVKAWAELPQTLGDVYGCYQTFDGDRIECAFRASDANTAFEFKLRFG